MSESAMTAAGSLQDLLIGIDIGSTNVKCAVYTAEARLLFASARPTYNAYRVWDLPNGRQKALDAELVWHLVCEASQEAAKHLGIQGLAAVKGLAVASVGCAPVLVDEKDKSLYPVLGQDLGVPKLYEQYERQTGPETYFAITGYPLESSGTGFGLAALSESDPAGFSRVQAILSVADYINLKLTGVRSREYSTAASMSLWDQRSSTWWKDFLDDIGLGPERLGKPVWSGTYLGDVTSLAAQETGLPEGTGVHLGGHDYLCAAFATGCTSPTSILNVTGTYEIMASFHAEPQNRREIADHRAMIDHHVFPNRYSLMVEAIGAGQTEWLRRTLAVPDKSGQVRLPEWGPLFAALESLPGSLGSTPEIFIPQIYGRHFPVRQTDVRGGYIGLTNRTTSVSLLRATIEGLAFQARQMLDYQLELCSSGKPRVVVVGGASRTRTWMQIKADVFGIPVSVPRTQEATALGAALLAGVGAGVYADYEEASRAAVGQGEDVYKPDPERSAFYTEVFHEVYLPLVETFQQVDQKLSRLAAGYRSEAPQVERRS